ncbi:predicted protein [Nematostella vectensis]|uniref:Sulfotransferase domain-containing protein n=1 Tax=Nematostella vectensis TaxID=45351 RepID=A7S6P5_NEMVE|nr:predicted protein [Nematostella vectensis]|eukprot:XP_001632655.1 predicted protein [Nematostella vectensis]
MFRHFFRLHMGFSLVMLVLKAVMSVVFMYRSIKYDEKTLEDSLQALNTKVQQQLLDSPKLKRLLERMDAEDKANTARENEPITRVGTDTVGRGRVNDASKYQDDKSTRSESERAVIKNRYDPSIRLDADSAPSEERDSQKIQEDTESGTSRNQERSIARQDNEIAANQIRDNSGARQDNEIAPNQIQDNSVARQDNEIAANQIRDNSGARLDVAIVPNEKREVATSNRENINLDEKAPKKKRKSLLIFGHDRSGTTFLSRMFNADPKIFNVYEPLWVTQHSFKPSAGAREILDVLKGLLGCKFSTTPSGITFLANISEWWSIRVNSNAMMSRHFCSIRDGKGENCLDMSRDSKRTDRVCREEYKHSVTKIATARTPQHKIATLLPRLLDENPDVDIRVLHVVRDPRGNVHSRLKLKWFPDHPHPRFDGMVKEICDDIVENMKYVKKQKEMDAQEVKRNRFMTVTYREIAGSPLETARKIYDFAGFQMDDALAQWIKKSTKPSKETLRKELEQPYSHVRNATGNADRWQKESPVGRVRAIERICQPLMRLLGLKRMETHEEG